MFFATESASGRRGNNLKRFKDFYLKAKARIGTSLSHVCHIRSTGYRGRECVPNALETIQVWSGKDCFIIMIFDDTPDAIANRWTISKQLSDFHGAYTRKGDVTGHTWYHQRVRLHCQPGSRVKPRSPIYPDVRANIAWISGYVGRHSR